MKIQLTMSVLLTDNNFEGFCGFEVENINEKHRDHSWLARRTRIAFTKKAVDDTNELMMEKLQGDEIYKTCDSVKEAVHR